MGQFLSAFNHQSIEFYGRVVDQTGAPLAGVAVYASVIYNSGVSAGVAKKQTSTDANGLFAITDMIGRTLGIGLGKPGYEYSGEHGPFQFTELVPPAERYHPNPKSPIVFVMYKLQGAEPMIHFDRRYFGVPADGSPVCIDLATGTRVPSGGDLTITLRQPMAAPGQWLRHYEWTARISAAGLLETTDKQMYLAPKTGYQSEFSYSNKGNESQPNATVTRRYYLKTADGQYARIEMEFTSQTNPDRGSDICLTWWLNPTPGSRNLEFDPAKAITPK